MEELETGYDPEEPADQEEEITEPEEEGPEQPEADQEETEPAGPDQEEDTETEDTEPEETEPEETEPEEAEPDGNPEEEEPEDGAYDTVTDAEEEPEEEPEQETVSGNDPAGSGDVIIFPEDYDLSTPGGEREDAGSIVQAVERQSDIMTAGFTCTCFMLGLLAGAVLIAGFRLRRV